MNLPSDRKLTTDELRAWLDRKPPPREHLSTITMLNTETGEVTCDSSECWCRADRLVCLVHGTPTCAHETCPAPAEARVVDCRDWYEFAAAARSTPKDDGRGCPFDEQLEAGHA